MRRFVLGTLLLAACASPASVPSQPPRADDDAAPVSNPAVPVTSVPPRQAAATKGKPEPDFEPYALDDAQMARARKIQPLVKQASIDHGVDANLINGIIWTESKFNPKARNRSGAKGLMQLMPITARAMGQKLGRPVRVYDPEFSVQAGAKLLSIMLERFDGDEELALFAFARGGGRVRAYQANGETEMPEGVQKFIERVRRGQKTFALLGFPEV